MNKTWSLSTIVIASLFIAAVAGTDGDEPHGSAGYMMLTPDELEWGPVASMGEGAEIAFIEGDISPSSRATSPGRSRSPSACAWRTATRSFPTCTRSMSG